MTRVYISSQSPILSFGAKIGQLRRERQVGQMVVPDRVVQAQRLVSAAPLVAGPRVPVHHEMVDAELAQPRAERDAALTAADHQNVGVAVPAEALHLGDRASLHVTRSL